MPKYKIGDTVSIIKLKINSHPIGVPSGMVRDISEQEVEIVSTHWNTRIDALVYRVRSKLMMGGSWVVAEVMIDSKFHRGVWLDA